MPTRTEQRDATRARILDAAREAFARDGYEAVSLAALVDDLGLTKGAFYHHFAKKQSLFVAVLGDVVDEVGERVAAAADRAPDAWDGLRAGCRAYLETAADDRMRRILLEDGPAVVGWARWLELDATSPARHLHEALTELARAGRLVDAPIDALTRLLSGGMNEAAMWVASRPGDPDALARAERALECVLEGVRARP